MMKNIFFILITLLFGGIVSLNAQNRMKIHHKDGTVSIYYTDDIDHIDWDEETATYKDITINGKTYKLGVSGAIDLGLSVKWAAYNVGASSPEDYGDYFSWGETETKSTYNWDSYFDSVYGSSSNFYKYASDKKNKLDLTDDVAHVKWGYNWRMPTTAEQYELYEMCTWVWKTYGGHNGYVVVGSTGNAIFLPAAGYRNNNSLSDDVGLNGDYWSSSLYSGYSNGAYGIGFYSGSISGRYYYERYYGRSVRAVRP